jgi:uncharacterized protein YndB with AHSA1/START domain
LGALACICFHLIVLLIALLTNRKYISQEKIIVKASIAAGKQKVWDYYTLPEHIINWNFAHPSWHCPSASNDMQVGGRYSTRMEVKDGSFGFDFDAVYSEINEGANFTYEFGGRFATVEFIDQSEQTEIVVTFAPETENSIELQQNEWQAILDSFKSCTESVS